MKVDINAAGAHVGASTTTLKSKEVSPDLIKVIKDKRDAIAQGGGKAKATISWTQDVDFDTIVIPALRAVMRAGFPRADIEFKPQGK